MIEKNCNSSASDYVPSLPVAISHIEGYGKGELLDTIQGN